jgi:hypothetical protein
MPKATTGYLPMPKNPKACVKKDGSDAGAESAAGVAVPFGSTPAASSAPAAASVMQKVNLEDDVEVEWITSDEESTKRPRLSPKPSAPHPGKESVLRGVSYTNMPMPKVQAKKPEAKIVRPSADIVVIDESTFEWDNIPYLKAMNEADKATWPIATCCRYRCGFKESWKLMETHRVYLSFEAKKGDAPDDYVFYRVCWRCVGSREKFFDDKGEVLEGPSRAYIRENKPDYVRKQKEGEKYRTAKLHVQLIFPMMKTCSKRNQAIRELESIDSFHMLFAPMAEFILIKDAQMDQLEKDASAAVKLMAELKKCEDPTKIRDLLDRIELLSLDAPMLAFEGQDDADRKWMATTFADEWVGCMGGWFRSYYVCGSWSKTNYGQKPTFTEESCNTVIPSKLWDRAIDDPMAPHQRYYCHCSTRHLAKWGQLIEMRTISGKMLYAWAEVPGGNIQDIRALKIAKECPNMTADEIFESLPVIPPTVQTGFIDVHPTANRGLDHTRFYKIDHKFFNSLQEFKWHQIFNMTGAPLQEVKATGKDAKKKAQWDKYYKEQEIQGRMAERAKARAKASGASSSSAK